MAYGKTIELYLVNGIADSIVEGELSNWNGKALRIPRIEVNACTRDAITWPGVYFLICKEEDGSDSVYIGEAENVKDRLMQHMRDYLAEKEKYYWKTAVVFVADDLNKALIRYLEYRLVEIAKSCKQYHVLTRNTYSNTRLKDSQKAAMEEFIDNVKLLMDALGYDILDPVPDKSESRESSNKATGEGAPYLHMEREIQNIGRVEADGRQTADGFVVFKGSKIALQDDDTLPESIRKRRKEAPVDDNGILQENMEFTSPSSAAMFLSGKSENGLTRWKTEDGIQLKYLGNEEGSH